MRAWRTCPTSSTKTATQRREAGTAERRQRRRVGGAAIKRGFDVVVAGTALVLLAPALALIALAIRLTMGRPVLYRQERPGLGGETFRLVKFRTMSQARDAAGRLLPDED